MFKRHDRKHRRKSSQRRGFFINSSNSAVTITGTVVTNNKALGFAVKVGGMIVVATVAGLHAV